MFGGLVVAQTTFDPTTIGVGARALGMGKAYAAIAEDGDTVFSNPAGLGEIDSFKFTSMSGLIMEDVNYTVLGGVYPLGQKSAIGIGYLMAGVGGITLRDVGGNYLGRANFENNVILLAYGKKLSDKFSLGITSKYFYQAGSETGNGDGTGLNFDLGILQSGTGWFSSGLIIKNILSNNKITYSTGEEEKLPQEIKVGTRMFLLGENFESAMNFPVEVALAIDADLSLSGSKPTATHTGIEVTPSSFLTLRTGIDQDIEPGSLQNNYTFGLTLRYVGLGFHYAYHTYNQANNGSTNFFSLSFDERGWAPEGPPDIFIGSTNQPILQ